MNKYDDRFEKIIGKSFAGMMADLCEEIAQHPEYIDSVYQQGQMQYTFNHDGMRAMMRHVKTFCDEVYDTLAPNQPIKFRSLAQVKS